MTDAKKQASYEAKRRAVTGIAAVPTVEFRVVMRDGTEKIERVIGLSQVAAYWPDAVQITRCDWGGFW